MTKGFISLHRKLMENPIWADPNYLKLWIYCLFKASHKKHDQLVGNQMVTLDVGQFITGRNSLAEDLNRGVKPDQQLSEKTWSRYLKNLEKWQMLTIKVTNKFSVVTIDKYEHYQDTFAKSDHQSDQQLTNNSPTSDQQLTTNNNGNNGNNENKDNIYTIFNHWKEKGIVVHKTINQKMESHINARLKEYELSDLIDAIDNYYEVLTNDEYYWTHCWTLQDFMKPNNVIRFLNSSKPLVTFRAKKSQESKQSIFNQGEESKKRQEEIKPSSPEEQELFKQWEEELPY